VRINPKIKNRPAPVAAAGERKRGRLALLEQGAHLLQDATPLRGFDVDVVGFHCPKDEPDSQMEAHHFCRVVNDDLLQCVLVDGNTRDATLIGIEYVVSERLSTRRPRTRRRTGTRTTSSCSGQLVAPGLPDAAEKAFFELLVNSYGKTWHTWHTGRHDGEPGHTLPMGDPKLMWSFNREGECDESLKADRLGLSPGWPCAASLPAELPLDALEMALRTRELAGHTRHGRLDEPAGAARDRGAPAGVGALPPIQQSMLVRAGGRPR
jgi:hypothetical protein